MRNVGQTFRHSRAALMLRSHADLRHIVAILGYSRIASTEINNHRYGEVDFQPWVLYSLYIHFIRSTIWKHN